MSDQVYLIERLWTFTLETNPIKALGYTPVGYVLDEKKAKEIVDQGRIFTYKNCWVIPTDEKVPEFKYTSIKSIDNILDVTTKEEIDMTFHRT